MATNYAGSAVWPSATQIPSDGEERDAASVNVALESLRDGSVYLKQHVDALETPATALRLIGMTYGTGSYSISNSTVTWGAGGSEQSLFADALTIANGDLIEIDCGFGVSSSASGDTVTRYSRVAYQVNSGTKTLFPGTLVSYQFPNGYHKYYAMVKGLWVVSGAPPFALFSATLQCATDGATGNVALGEPVTWVCRQWRAV